MKDWHTLVPVREMATHTADPTWVVFDCRFDLTDPTAGERSYRDGHLPGAYRADLEAHLSAAHVPGRTGRHPLPSLDAFRSLVAAWGISASDQVVAYDASGGAFAARLWWMLRWLGLTRVAVLDGGYSSWTEEGLPIQQAIPAARQARSDVQTTSTARLPRTVTTTQVAAHVTRSDAVLVDARDLARFRGEVEPIDPVAGHIPGALCLPCSENLDGRGRFRPKAELASRFAPVCDRGLPIVAYCGSGVTATHNILAMVHAGLEEPMLYAGSYSEWITDASRPVETGPWPRDTG